MAQNRGLWAQFSFWPYSSFIWISVGSVWLGWDSGIRSASENSGLRAQFWRACKEILGFLRIMFLAALAALYLTMVSQWVSDKKDKKTKANRDRSKREFDIATLGSFALLQCFIHRCIKAIDLAAMSEKLCLQWNDFKEHVNSAFGKTRKGYKS